MTHRDTIASALRNGWTIAKKICTRKRLYNLIVQSMQIGAMLRCMEIGIDATKLISRAGGARAMADMLDDITTQAVYAWEKNGVPKGRLYELMIKRPEWFAPDGSLADVPIA